MYLEDGCRRHRISFTLVRGGPKDCGQDARGVFQEIASRLREHARVEFPSPRRKVLAKAAHRNARSG